MSAVPPVLVSHHAGLLYALNILAHPEASVALLPGLPGRPSTWTMWHLGAALAGSASDPAVALFAGRMPADGPPGSLPDGSAGPGSSPSPAEADAITTAAALVGFELAWRMGAQGSPDAVVRRVVDRAARIEAVDGWADVSFDLDAIDLDIRIAGLDRDPGFVALLGTVVRFHYV